jgi:phosphatidylglycerol:prolipoprotein diacylglycerol transferase
MHPTLHIPFLDLAVRSHNVMVLAAIVAAGGLGYYWTVRAEGLDAARVRWAFVGLGVAAFAGGRLHFVLANWSSFAADPWRIFRLSSGALHAPGAMVALTLTGAVLLPLLRLPIGRFVDGLAPAVGVGIAFARIGCFLHGCCYGVVCPYPWGVTLSSDSYLYMLQLESGQLANKAVRSLPVHPLPLYFAAAGLAITAILLWLRPRRRYPGQLGLLLLLLFSASSALLEPLRSADPTRVYWGPWPQLLWVTAGMTVVSVVLLVVAELVHRAGRVPGSVGGGR